MPIFLNRLLGRAPAVSAVAARPPWSASPGADEPPPGCGWFDSSHELHTGLWVREHASPDDVANDLPLAAWLELHLAAGPAQPRP